VRQIPLSHGALQLVEDWRARAKQLKPDSLVFSTWSGKPISPNNVSRQQIFPACKALGGACDVVDVPADLFVLGAREGRTRQGRRAADGPRQGRYDTERLHSGSRRGTSGGGRQDWIGIVHNCSQFGRTAGANRLKGLAPQPGFEPGTLRLTGGKNVVSRPLRRCAGRCRITRHHA
jgi:hypothetical protein